ncbi:hypothetical protein E4T56_gene11989 [Termitomyces sp. T112]|nr:hypothetical protein E4T56_gene11989 [Termitomyces sp. T112]
MSGLEDVKTGKLITVCDVCFVENDSPGDLAEFKTHGNPPSAENLAALVPEDTANASPAPAPPPIVLMPAPTATPPTEALPIATKPMPASAAPKTSKHSNLPSRDHTIHIQHPVKCYGIMPINDDTSEEEHNGQHQAYIAFEENEPRTYHEAMSATCSKQWEEAIATEYQTLQQTGTFEWVAKLPKGQRAIGSRIMFCMKCNGNRNVSKYKAQIVTKGSSQVHGQDFIEIFSSIAKFTTLWTLLSIIACKD